MNRDQILQQGFVITKVTVTGIRQTHRLDIAKEKNGAGQFVYLTGRFPIPEAEMVRLAEELGLPIKSRDKIAFPRGKGKSDFTETITFEAGTIEAEIE